MHSVPVMYFSGAAGRYNNTASLGAAASTWKQLRASTRYRAREFPPASGAAHQRSAAASWPFNRACARLSLLPSSGPAPRRRSSPALPRQPANNAALPAPKMAARAAPRGPRYLLIARTQPRRCRLAPFSQNVPEPAPGPAPSSCQDAMAGPCTRSSACPALHKRSLRSLKKAHSCHNPIRHNSPVHTYTLHFTNLLQQPESLHLSGCWRSTAMSGR